MKLGFTGTQIGMTSDQKQFFREAIDARKPKEFHHGDCIGADLDSHIITVDSVPKIILHPPEDPIKQANCRLIELGVKQVIELPRKPYLERNHDIVDATDLLIACPKSKEEELRSGTWATVRYARKIKKPILIIYPDGSLKYEN